MSMFHIIATDHGCGKHPILFSNTKNYLTLVVFIRFCKVALEHRLVAAKLVGTRTSSEHKDHAEPLNIELT